MLFNTHQYRKPFSEVSGLAVPAAGFMRLAGKIKPQHGPEGEGQQKGEAAMLIIQVRLLGSALCLTAKGVLPYTVLSPTQRMKDKVESKKL